MAAGEGLRSGMLAVALLCSVASCSHRDAGGRSRTAVSLPAPTVAQPTSKPPVGAYLPERNLCIDRELARRDLNEFGDPKGTTYARGAPQGVTTTLDRYDYVLKRRPEIATACTKAPDEEER